MLDLVFPFLLLFDVDMMFGHPGIIAIEYRKPSRNFEVGERSDFMVFLLHAPYFFMRQHDCIKYLQVSGSATGLPLQKHDVTNVEREIQCLDHNSNIGMGEPSHGISLDKEMFLYCINTTARHL